MLATTVLLTFDGHRDCWSFNISYNQEIKQFLTKEPRWLFSDL